MTVDLDEDIYRKLPGSWDRDRRIDRGAILSAGEVHMTRKIGGGSPRVRHEGPSSIVPAREVAPPPEEIVMPAVIYGNLRTDWRDRELRRALLIGSFAITDVPPPAFKPVTRLERWRLRVVLGFARLLLWLGREPRARP
jgi:hypothetical protein